MLFLLSAALMLPSAGAVAATRGLTSPLKQIRMRSLSPMRSGCQERLISPRSMALDSLSDRARERLDNIRQPEMPEPKETIFYQVPESIPKLGEKYAVVEVGGSQVIVEEGRWYTVKRLKANVGDVIRLPRVLLMKLGEDKVQLGLPYLEEGIVEAQVVEHLRGNKLTAGKYKPKKHYRRKWGARDELTKFVVTKIHSDGGEFIPNLEN